MAAETQKPVLLVVEDDIGLQKQLRWSLDAYQVAFAANAEEALAQIRRLEPAVVLQDLGLPPQSAGIEEGMRLLEQTVRLMPHTKVIVVTGNAEKDAGVRAVARGAYDFFAKPIDLDALALVLQRAYHIHGLELENERLAERQGPYALGGAAGASEVFLKVTRLIEKVGPTSATLLLLGESGTGKEVLARAAHAMSPRSARPFVAINCAAIPEALLESELFGHERGAFTGAVRQSIGRVEQADGGTLFLDEIGDMPLALQAKLLRFLQERVIERIGGREAIPVDVRVVCATNRDLQKAIQAGSFREDLFYRVSEIVVDIPPLRERKGDALMLARIFIDQAARKHGRPVLPLSEGARRALDAYGWPGNVRELENKVTRAVLVADGREIVAADLGLEEAVDGEDVLNLRAVRSEAERRAVRQALGVSGGNLSRAAELLGITRPTLYDLLRRLGLDAASYGPQAEERTGAAAVDTRPGGNPPVVS